MAMSERAKAARAAYMREYKKKNRERLKAQRKAQEERYWERKAEKMEQATAEESEGTQDD